MVMGSDARSWRFRRFAAEDNDSNDQFLVMSRVHENQEDFEASTLDLTVCCNDERWNGAGLPKPQTRHANALRRIVAALGTRAISETSELKARFTRKGDKLQVVCQWKDEGASVFATHQPFELAKDSSGLQSGVLIFDTLLEKCDALEADNTKCTDQVSEFQLLAEKSQQLVRDFVEKRGDRDVELYSRFAAVLNEKKKKLRELKAEIDKLKGQEPGADKASEQGYSTDPSEDERNSGEKSREQDSVMEADTQPMDDTDEEVSTRDVAESSKGRGSKKRGKRKGTGTAEDA